MKSKDSELIGIEYLSSESLATFAKSYLTSFPELEINFSYVVSFLKRKFLVLENSSTHNIAALVTHDGFVASGYGIIRNNYSQGNKTLGVGLVCDVFTSTNYRNLGLFRRVSLLAIHREELTKTNFLIGFPVRDEVMPGHLSVGWKYIFNMPLWWSLPRPGWLREVQKNPDLNGSMFIIQKGGIALRASDQFVKWRFSYQNVDYYLVSIQNSTDFAIVRKAKLRKLPFACIVYMQSSNKSNAKILVRKIQIFALHIGSFGVLGCWNDSYANDLFLPYSGLRKSSKFQKVIVRELNGFECPKDDKGYRLSWMDSDTL